jgi:hypothetical protein
MRFEPVKVLSEARGGEYAQNMDTMDFWQKGEFPRLALGLLLTLQFFFPMYVLAYRHVMPTKSQGYPSWSFGRLLRTQHD